MIIGLGSGCIVGRYKPDGAMHVAVMHDVAEHVADHSDLLVWQTHGMVRLMTWCGGDLPVRFDVDTIAADEVREHLTCRNCLGSLGIYTLPTTVRTTVTA